MILTSTGALHLTISITTANDAGVAKQGLEREGAG